MLKLKILSTESYDEIKEEFIYSKEQVLQLEHSLVSLSKWESKWNTPFLAKTEKTEKEIIDYIKCMTITQNVDDKVYKGLTKTNIEEVEKYIRSEMTATTFSKDNKTVNREIITSEIIYYWMISLNIPVEFQKWHLSRLLTLINVCNIKNSPSKNMSKKEMMSRNSEINNARRKKLNTKG